MPRWPPACGRCALTAHVGSSTASRRSPSSCASRAINNRGVLVSAFRWEAVDAQGRLRHGLLDADTARAARDRLRADGLTPTAVESAPNRGDALAQTHLPAGEVALSTRQLATLTQSGMPLDQALAAVAEQPDRPKAARVFTSLR